MNFNAYSSQYSYGANIVATATNVSISSSLGTALTKIYITSLFISTQFVDNTTGTAINGMATVSTLNSSNTPYSVQIPGLSTRYTSSLSFNVYSNFYTPVNFIIAPGENFGFNVVLRLYQAATNTTTAGCNITMNYNLLD